MGTENIKWCINKRESKYDKNKKHKSEFKFQSPEKLEHYFEEMALNGWKLVEIRFGNCYVFEECKPVRLRFMVNILEIISFTRKDAEEKNRDFLEFCENKGWDYVYHTNSVSVFCTEDKEIQKVEIEDISIMNKKYRLIFSVSTLIINIIFAFFNYNINMLDIVMDYGALYLAVIKILLILFSVIWVVDSFLKYKKYLNKDKEDLIYKFTCIIILLVTLASALCLYASKYYYGERGYSVLVYILPFICIEVITFMLTITTEKLRMPTIVLIVLFIGFQIVIVPKIVSDFGLIGKYYEIYTEKPQNVMKCEDIEKNALDIIGDKYSCEPIAIHSDGNVETSFILKYETYEMKIDYPDERVSVQFYVANSDNKYVIKKIVEKIYNQEKVVESDEIDAKFESMARTRKLIREKDYELDDGIKILFSPYEECWYEIKDSAFSYRYVFYNDNTVMFVDFSNYIEISPKMCNAIRDMFKQYN